MHPAAKIIAAGYVAVACGVAALLWPTDVPVEQRPTGINWPSDEISATSGGAPLSLPSDIILPNLERWSLVFVGGRRIVSEGKPAFQFAYTTNNKDLGPITLFVTNTREADVEPTFDKRENVNLLYWRHRGHGYYIVGGANRGWMWSLKNDIAYQLKAM